MKHWVFIIILSLFLTSKPTPISKGQEKNNVIDTTITDQIKDLETEKKHILGAMNLNHDTIAGQLTKVQPKKKISRQLVKTIVKHDTVLIHDTVTVEKKDIKIIPVKADTRVVLKPMIIKKRGLLYRVFHKKKDKQ